MLMLFTIFSNFYFKSTFRLNKPKHSARGTKQKTVSFPKHSHDAFGLFVLFAYKKNIFINLNVFNIEKMAILLALIGKSPYLSKVIDLYDK